MFHYIIGKPVNLLTVKNGSNSKNFKSTLSKIHEWYKSVWNPKPEAPPFKHICQIGDPVLRRTAANVNLNELNSEYIQRTLNNMKTVMKHYRAVGIAAPQIGIPLRIIMIEYPESFKKYLSEETIKSREITTIPFKVFINPTMEVKNYQKIYFPESCESIKGMSALVPRFKKVVVKGYDASGAKVEWETGGWGARIVQHEIEHLDGRLYTDSMDSKSLQVDEWYRINARQGNFYLYYKQRY